MVGKRAFSKKKCPFFAGHAFVFAGVFVKFTRKQKKHQAPTKSDAFFQRILKTCIPRFLSTKKGSIPVPWQTSILAWPTTSMDPVSVKKNIHHTVAFGQFLFQTSAAWPRKKHPEDLLEGSCFFDWWVHSFIDPQVAAWRQQRSEFAPREVCWFFWGGKVGKNTLFGEIFPEKRHSFQHLPAWNLASFSVSRASYCKGNQTWRDGCLCAMVKGKVPIKTIRMPHSTNASRD